DLDNAIIDGEVVILDEEGRSDFQLLQNAIKSEQTRNMYYYAFDLMHFGNRDLRQEPLEDRKRQLQTLMRKSVPRVRLSADFNGSGKDLLELAREHHLEGIISKERHSTYRSERNSNWVKTKCTHEQEFVIGGFTDARGSRNHFGALLLGYYKNKQLHYAGRVGTGFTQKSLDEIRKKLKPLETGKSPFTKNSPRERDIHFVRPVLSAQVTFGNWTSDGILRVPVFHGLREDKPAKEIIREKPKKAVSEDSWAISSPEKILFKSEKISKKEVAHYYSIAAAWLVPLVTDRPLSLVRCPSGTSEKCFFQKHPTTMPKAMTPVRLKEEKGSGVYASLHDAEGLAALVQMNAFEIHCSNCRRDDVIHPDQFVMDLDPGPGVPWKQVVASAVELRDLLEKLGLKSFVKLSGGKGLHLHVPIAPLYTWDEINSFTRALALQLEQIKPDLYVSKMTKNIRGGKIFVDYLRNSRGATAVAPYSLRARAVSSVALPVDWADLKKIKTPDEFTLRKTLAHLVKRRRDPWKDYFKIKQRIPLLDKTTRKKQDSVAYSGGASV
ncbi:MAG: DNA ligase D, partial [Bdellovibrio sp.]|nr:DNA ligase D [Bdellovibrio sp.]